MRGTEQRKVYVQARRNIDRDRRPGDKIKNDPWYNEHFVTSAHNAPAPPISSAGLITATSTLISSVLPPAKLLPSSLALLANGISLLGLAGRLALASLTFLARLHSASESIPAKARRPSFAPTPVLGGAMEARRKRMTSSRTSSSQRLSLRPSEARMRMSSARTGSVRS